MVGAAACAELAAGRSRRAVAAPLRDRAGVAADPPPGRVLAFGDSRRAELVARRHGGDRAPLSGPHWPDLGHNLQPVASLVLVPADAAERGAGLQGLRFAERRARSLYRAYRIRRPDNAAGCAA